MQPITHNPKPRILREDTVVVIAGKDKGKKGKVEKVFPEVRTIVVSGVNLTKKHVKRTRRHPEGGRVEYASPINLGKVMLICPNCSKAARVGLKVEGGKKIRFCKRCGRSIGGKVGN